MDCENGIKIRYLSKLGQNLNIPNIKYMKDKTKRGDRKMKRKILVGLIAIIAIVVAAMFVGCIEEEEISIPTSKETNKYIPGDILAKPEQTERGCFLVLNYNETGEKYEMIEIHRNKEKEWCLTVRYVRAFDRGDVEKSSLMLIAHVDNLPCDRKDLPVSNNVKKIEIKTFGIRDMDITFIDEWCREFEKLNDGVTQINMKTSDASTLIDEENINIDAEQEFKDIDLPNMTRNNFECEALNVTITLPNGKNASVQMDFNYRRKERAREYAIGYSHGGRNARDGYSAKIPWERSELYRDGYTDGYIGAKERYEYPITTEIIIMR